MADRSVPSVNRAGGFRFSLCHTDIGNRELLSLLHFRKILFLSTPLLPRPLSGFHKLLSSRESDHGSPGSKNLLSGNLTRQRCLLILIGRIEHGKKAAHDEIIDLPLFIAHMNIGRSLLRGNDRVMVVDLTVIDKGRFPWIF